MLMPLVANPKTRDRIRRSVFGLDPLARHDQEAGGVVGGVLDSRGERIESVERVVYWQHGSFGLSGPNLLDGFLETCAEAGFQLVRPFWSLLPRGPKAVRDQAGALEVQARAFYERAASLSTDLRTCELLTELALEEVGHEQKFAALEVSGQQVAHAAEEERHRRRFLLQYVQPGLAGLMDGSVSTLAPLFAAAFATPSSWRRFLSVSRPRSGPASLWGLPRRCRMMTLSPGGARRSSPGGATFLDSSNLV